MVQEKENISVYRSKLDDTLTCDDLRDQEVVHSLVKNQILRSRTDDFEGDIEDVVETRTKDVSTLLEMLQSASATNMKSGDMSERSWNIKTDNNEFRVMYREGPVGTPLHELLVEGFVDGPVDVLLCISWESILYKQWWPEVSFPPFKVISSDCIKRIRNGEQVSLVRMKLPWPLSDREALVHYFELEYFEKDLIVVLLNSLPDSKDANGNAYSFTWEGIPDAGNAKRIDVVGGFAHLKVDANRTYFRIVARMDVKLDWLPPSLINFVSRQIIGIGFKLFKKEVESVSKDNRKFSERLKDPLYERVRKAMYLQSYENHVTETKDAKFQQTTEIHEAEEENHVMDNVSPQNGTMDLMARGREVTPPLSPEVKHALETLDNVISLLRDHRLNTEKRQSIVNNIQSLNSSVPAEAEESSSTKVGSQDSNLVKSRITSGKMDRAVNGSISSESCPVGSSDTKCLQNGSGKASSSNGKRMKSLIVAALLPCRFRREAKVK